MSFYDLLGVPFGAHSDEIKAAYRAKVKLCHPDLHPGDENAAASFLALTEAYNALMADFPGYKPLPIRSNAPRKKMQDKPVRRRVTCDIHQLFLGTRITLKDINAECKPCGGTGEIHVQKPVDCLHCYGRGFAYREQGLIRVKVQCMYCSGTGKREYMPCDDCGGRGRIKAPSAEVTIPADTLPGTILSFPNGAPDNDTGSFTTLEVRVDLLDANYKVEGVNIFHIRRLPVWDLAMGTKTEVVMPSGRTVTLTVPPATLPGRIFNVLDGGFRAEDGSRGVFGVIAALELPDVTNPEVVKALNLLRRASNTSSNSVGRDQV